LGAASGSSGSASPRTAAGGADAAVAADALSISLRTWTAVADDARSDHPTTFFEVPVSPA
ncbi:hypothetical protein, partial [Cellulosimicrobium cellulans]|uniref:hypothetical protein n=1 Tax=Cellulosimicrobium cellulans TaxID=1710 RepID=UPI00149580D5